MSGEIVPHKFWMVLDGCYMADIHQVLDDAGFIVAFGDGVCIVRSRRSERGDGK